RVTEEATKWFKFQLNTGIAAEARDYLKGRRLRPETLDRFEIGFAPSVPDALLKALEQKGISWDLIEGAGLALAEDDGRRRDRFINRIIFPIRDARGRCIGFGGRAMNPKSPAKYLNSPETELFDKGANLYNLGPARKAAGQSQTLVVAEGYMDVIALAQAGFEAAVAPLGTAVTERQLQLLWRVTPEPLIALDGDAAGQRAGLRVADLALPLIEAGQALRFAILPVGKDPDDLIRDEGPEAMQAVLNEAKSMLALLWRREIDGKDFDSPERRATLDRDLRALVRRIEDPTLRRHYGEEIGRLRADLFGLSPAGPASFDARRDRSWAPGPWKKGQRWQPPAKAMTSTRASALASGATTPDTMLEQVALAGLTLHPELLDDFSDALEGGSWSTEGHAAFATALLGADPTATRDETRETLHHRLGPESLDSLLAQRHIRISPVTRGDAATARLCIHDALSKLAARRGADRERREAMEDFEDGADEALTWRLAQATRRRDATGRVATDMLDGMGEEASHADFYDSLLATPAGKKMD
ncbi:MAG: toprim domain-containing protein, partial [Pseudomonadota bacterium]